MYASARKEGRKEGRKGSMGSCVKARLSKPLSLSPGSLTEGMSARNVDSVELSSSSYAIEAKRGVNELDQASFRSG